MSRFGFVMGLLWVGGLMWLVIALYTNHERQSQADAPDQIVVVPYDAAATTSAMPMLPLDEICFKRPTHPPKNRNV